MLKEKSSPLAQWVDRIRREEIPAFNATAQKVAAVASDERASVVALAAVVLQDAALTTRLLRLVNSVIFESGGPQVTTINRAILILGFVPIRQLSLAVGLVEVLLAKGARQRARLLMTRSYHAALQARAIAIQRRDPHPEDMFVATLLYRLGEFAFWCCGGATADELERRLKRGGLSSEAEYEVLGFRLFQLTGELARVWDLHPVLIDATKGLIHRDTREEAIAFGWRIAELAESGWETDKMTALIGSVGHYVGRKPDLVRSLVYSNARKAAAIVADFGIKTDAPLFAVPPEAELEED